ncbi:MAG: hypothetical protein KUG80_00065 [Gammaproteobacteria bacterium]|nr:hypothetical protein [Gammaproteobacteria bacterium]
MPQIRHQYCSIWASEVIQLIFARGGCKSGRGTAYQEALIRKYRHMPICRVGVKLKTLILIYIISPCRLGAAYYRALSADN